MLKILKFSGLECNFFMISDLHVNHSKSFLFGKRYGIDGVMYKDIESHDSALVTNWNSVCNGESIVFNLGDVIFNDPDGTGFENLMRRLSFNKHYIFLGNHVSGHRQIYLKTLKSAFPNAFINDELSPAFEVYPLSYNVNGDPNKQVIFVPQYAEVQINSTKLVLSHFPIRSWNYMGHGSLMIHGHQHYSDPSSHAVNLDSGKVLDVSVEGLCAYNEGKPINLIQIKKILDKKKIKEVDHHNKNTT